MGTQIGPYLVERVQRFGHRRGLDDVVHREEQVHQGIIREFEQEFAAAGVGAQFPDDGVDPAAMEGFDGVAELLGLLPRGGFQVLDGGRRLIQRLRQRVEAGFVPLRPDRPSAAHRWTPRSSGAAGRTKRIMIAYSLTGWFPLGRVWTRPWVPSHDPIRLTGHRRNRPGI